MIREVCWALLVVAAGCVETGSRSQVAASVVDKKEAAKKPVANTLTKTESDAWIESILSKCELGLNRKPCDTPPPAATEEQRKECVTLCTTAIRSATERLTQSTLDECEKQALAQPADAPFPKCQIEFPPGSDLYGDGRTIPTERLSCVDICRHRVWTIRRNSTQDGQRANATGETIVMAYRKCMKAADSTMEARNYAANDSHKHELLLGNADYKCRVANNCEWLERHSDWQCTYDTLEL